ncbi:MAG: hypothetical protein JW973_10330 [Bacteroidales bacterium]|nr:hypothetical protein [Bacteroidales bacterium]
MEAIELKQLMAEYNHKLDEIIHFNKVTAAKNLQLKKPQKKMSSLLLYRIFELVFYGSVVFFMGFFVAHHWNETHFVISGIIIEIFAIIAFIGSIGQVVLVSQIDYSKPIVEIRKKIELVNAHGLLFLKLLLISISVWWVYAIVGLFLLLGIDIYPYLEPDFVIKYLVVNGLLIVPLIWFLHKLSYKNLHIKWVKKTIESVTSTKTKKALDFLKEIDLFEE